MGLLSALSNIWAGVTSVQLARQRKRVEPGFGAYWIERARRARLKRERGTQ